MFAAAYDDSQGASESSRRAAADRLTRLVWTVEPFRQQVLDFLASSFEAELRECTMLLDDEFWPESEDDDDANDADADLKKVADKAAVERVMSAYDYFDVLCLPRECGKGEVKKAFFRLSKEVHPDKNGAKGANEAFDKLNNARETLMDEEARADYVSRHPPRAAAAREWAKAVDRGVARWESTKASAADTGFHRSRG